MDAELLRERLRSIQGIHGDRDELRAAPLEFSNLPLQLTELLSAVRSPVPAVEDEHRGSGAKRAREVPRSAARDGQRDRRRAGSHGNGALLDPRWRARAPWVGR